MGSCNYTQNISPNECLGDSLATINANFSALDSYICDLPILQSGLSTKYNFEINEQGNPVEAVSITNSFEYNKLFDFTDGVNETNVALNDGTEISVYEFPYVGDFNSSKPRATFTSLFKTNQPPKVSVFWTASGSDNTTVYNTNKNNLPTDRGPIWFNGTVNAIKIESGFAFIGGEFTEVGGTVSKKFARINLNGGDLDPTFGRSGSFAGNQFGLTDLGDTGTINAIERVNIGSTATFLIIGGSFKSPNRGRGLCILNTQNGIFYPFYVNGEVHSLHVKGNMLYIGGNFNFINYTAGALTLASGLRANAKGLIRINLSTLINVPDIAIDRQFANKMSQIFEGTTAVINSITSHNNDIFIGGNFKVKENLKLVSQNIIAINENGNRNQQFNYILNGPVYSLIVDNVTSIVNLYVGGDFTRCRVSSQLYSTPQDNDEITFCNNAIAIVLESNNFLPYLLDTLWKPKFNKPVTNFALHDQAEQTFIYCYGKFTSVNDIAVSYLAALNKAVNSSVSANVLAWKPFLEKGSPILNNSFERFSTSLLIGGSFTRVNNQYRYRLVRINGFNESIITTPLSAVTWDLGAEIINQGMTLSMNFNSSETQRVSSVAGPWDTINCTTFPINNELFNDIEDGQLCRFFLRRPGNSVPGIQSGIGFNNATNDTYKNSAFVLGWKIDYNS